ATGMWTPVITLVQRWFAFHRRGLALGILSTGYGLGFASMGALFPLIVLHLNWRYTWYLLGLLAGIMIVVNLLLLKSDPAGAGYRPWGEAEKEKTDVLGQPPPGEANRLADIFKNRNFWLLGFSYFAIAYALYGATTFMVDYAEYQLNFSLEKSSFLATIHGLSQLAGVLIILPLSDIWGRKKTILISNLMIVLALTGLLFTSSSWVMLCLAVGGMAVFYGATFPIYGACAGDYFPREHMGTVIGAWTPFYGAGAIATHWISGLLRDRTGVYDHAFFINITMAAVALILIAAVSEQKKPIIWKKFPSC
ncbi:MFS transporter, partial [bacterium]|nr:MFS transporter [bacterium]